MNTSSVSSIPSSSSNSPKTDSNNQNTLIKGIPVRWDPRLQNSKGELVATLATAEQWTQLTANEQYEWLTNSTTPVSLQPKTQDTTKDTVNIQGNAATTIQEENQEGNKDKEITDQKPPTFLGKIFKTITSPFRWILNLLGIGTKENAQKDENKPDLLDVIGKITNTASKIFSIFV